MRNHTLRPALLCLAVMASTACPAAEGADCLDYEGEYRATMEVVKGRSAGLETDQMRDKARDKFEACERDERRRNARTTVCTFVNGDKVCRTE